MSPNAPVDFGGPSTSAWLVNTALTRIPSFKYIVGGAAVIVVAAAATKVWSDARAGYIAGAGLLPFAFLLYLFEKVPPTAKSTRLIAATVFWAVAAALIALLFLFVLWIAGSLLTSSPVHLSRAVASNSVAQESVPNQAEQEVLTKVHEIQDLAAKWQSALLQNEPGIAQLSTDAAEAADDLSAVKSNLLGAEYRISRLRYESFGNLVACSSAQLSTHPEAARSYCNAAEKAGHEALEAVVQLERRRPEGPHEQTILDWTRGQRDRILRANAEIDAVLLNLTQQEVYRHRACAALDQLSLGYRAIDPASTSVILRMYLGLKDGSDVCTKK